jgi:hypothetical protein
VLERVSRKHYITTHVDKPFEEGWEPDTFGSDMIRRYKEMEQRLEHPTEDEPEAMEANRDEEQEGPKEESDADDAYEESNRTKKRKVSRHGAGPSKRLKSEQ